MLKALGEGETDPAALAALADQRLRATPAELRDALGACSELNPVYRRLVNMALADLQLIEQQVDQLDQEIAGLLRQHQDAVERLAEVPGLGVDSAQQIIAEVGAKAPKSVVEIRVENRYEGRGDDVAHAGLGNASTLAIERSLGRASRHHI
jgi:transposase